MSGLAERASSPAASDRKPNNGMPRIAFITTVYDRSNVGGATFVDQLRRAVEAGSIDLTFFSDDISAESATYERKVVIPRLLRRLPGGFVVRGFYLRRAVLRDHNHRPFDVIWHNNVLTSFTVGRRRSAVPVVGMINDYSNAQAVSPLALRRMLGWYRAMIRYFWRIIERRSALQRGMVVVNSNFLHREISRRYDIPGHRLHVLYKAVALTDAPRVASSLHVDPLRVLFAKRDYVTGGLEDLFRAAAKLSYRVRISVAGPEAVHFDRIRSLAASARYTGELCLLGSLNRHRMLEQFAANDLLCIPSRSEALGIAFMEALAAGLPAIGTNVGGIPEVLDDGRAGWLAAPYDIDDIARQIRSVCEDAALRERKRRHGLDHVQRFSTDAMVVRFNELANVAMRR